MSDPKSQLATSEFIARQTDEITTLRARIARLEGELRDMRCLTSFGCSEPDLKRQLLVTNNLMARNAHGEMSNLWLVNSAHKANNGHWMAFDDAGRRIEMLTHWKYAMPALQPESTAPKQEERREDGQRKALESTIAELQEELAIAKSQGYLDHNPAPIPENADHEFYEHALNSEASLRRGNWVHHCHV